jgi:hypothetical protein
VIQKNNANSNQTEFLPIDEAPGNIDLLQNIVALHDLVADVLPAANVTESRVLVAFDYVLRISAAV